MEEKEKTILKRKVLFEKRIYFYGNISFLSDRIYIIKKCEIEDIKLSNHREELKKYISENRNEFFVCIKNDGVGTIVLKESVSFCKK